MVESNRKLEGIIDNHNLACLSRVHKRKMKKIQGFYNLPLKIKCGTIIKTVFSVRAGMVSWEKRDLMEENTRKHTAMHIYFAPLEGITTYPYRNLHHKYFGGVEKYFTPFLAPGPEQGMSVKEMRDVLPENNAGVPVVPQILTNRAGDFLLTAKKLAEMGYGEINLNLGCPSGTVTAKKKGSGFLLYPDDLDMFFDEVFSDASVRNEEFKVSVKTRIGKNEVEEWPEIMAVYNRYPISELTVHPRIQKEFYKGVPHLDVFADILKESRNPVVYNGDLFTVEHVKNFQKKFPTVETVMIGRGLIRNPALAELIQKEENSAEKAHDSAVTGVENKEKSLEQSEKNVLDSRNTGINIMPRIRAFHDEIFEHYRETMSGDRNLLFRMKDLWSYMLAEVPDSEKLAKKIRKSQHVPEYLAAVDEAFAGW